MDLERWQPTEAVSRFFNEISALRNQRQKILIASSDKLKFEICNHFDELVSTTDDLNQLEQAIEDAQKIYKFYTKDQNPIFKEGLMRLFEILEQAKRRAGRIISQQAPKTTIAR